MEAIQIQLAGLWVAVVLLYLYGDVFRIFSGDYLRSDGIDLKKLTQPMWLGMAVLMSIPIIMIVVALLVVDPSINRWANIIAAGFFFLFNVVGLPSYPSAYDRYLLFVSLVFNIITMVLAWNWV